MSTPAEEACSGFFRSFEGRDDAYNHVSVESMNPKSQLQRAATPKRISNLDPDLSLMFQISN